MNTIKLNTIGDSPVVVKKGSQVQSQEKTVEITENGTTEVVPDAGYALSKVTVNTNVESSGSVSKYIKGIEYYAVDYDKLVELGYDSTNTSVTSPSGMLNKTILPACGGKLSANGESMILGPGLFNFYKDIFTFAGITGIYYINVLQQNPDDPSIWFAPTFKEHMASLPIGGAFNEALTEITEEEFYSLGSEFVSIRDLYQPTASDVDMNTGYFDGVTNCDKITEIQVLGPTVYEEVDQLAVSFMNTSKNFVASLVIRTTENDVRLIWNSESATDGVSSGVIYTITPDNVVTRNEEEIDKFNTILVGDDFRYAIANANAGFTEAQFDILDKFIKVKKG